MRRVEITSKEARIGNDWDFRILQGGLGPLLLFSLVPAILRFRVLPWVV